MFLRSLLQRKHKKDHEAEVSQPSKPTNEGKKPKTTGSNRHTLNGERQQSVDNIDVKKNDVPTKHPEAATPVPEDSSPGVVADGTPQDTQQPGEDSPGEVVPPPSSPLSPQQDEPEEEFTTPTSGLCEEMSPARETTMIPVGQQGDGTFKDEQLTNDESDDHPEDRDSEDEGFSGSDSQIEELIREVIATVSQDLQRESSVQENGTAGLVDHQNGRPSGESEPKYTKNHRVEPPLVSQFKWSYIDVGVEETPRSNFSETAPVPSRPGELGGMVGSVTEVVKGGSDVSSDKPGDDDICATLCPVLSRSDEIRRVDDNENDGLKNNTSTRSVFRSHNECNNHGYSPPGDDIDIDILPTAKEMNSFEEVVLIPKKLDPVVSSTDAAPTHVERDQATCYPPVNSENISVQQSETKKDEPPATDGHQMEYRNEAVTMTEPGEDLDNVKTALAGIGVKKDIDEKEIGDAKRSVVERVALLEQQVNKRINAAIDEAKRRDGGGDLGTPIAARDIADGIELNDSDGQPLLHEPIISKYPEPRQEMEQGATSANSVWTDSRSKSRSGNVLACRFYMDEDNDHFQKNVTSSPIQGIHNGVSAFYGGYSGGHYNGMRGCPEITPIRYQNGGYKGYSQEHQEGYSVTESENTDDFSNVAAHGSKTWSRIQDVTDSSPYELNDFECSDRYEVCVPRPSLDDFVITPCDDSDSDDGEECAQDIPEETQPKEVRETSSTEFLRSKLNPVAKEWVKGGNYGLPGTGSFSNKDSGGSPSSPAEAGEKDQQSVEEKQKMLAAWERFRADNMDAALRTLITKLDSRPDKLPEHLEDQLKELKFKISSVIDQERQIDASSPAEDEGEISLMDMQVSVVMDQQASLALSLKNTEERTKIMETQMEQWEVSEEERKKQVVSLREEVEDATARQRSLTVMLNDERRLKEALQLRLATMTQEKQQLLYNNVMLWEQTSQLELKQEQFQGVSDQERRELEDQMKALETELIELRSRKSGEPSKKISVESASSGPSDQEQPADNATTPGGEQAGVDGTNQGGYMTPRHGRYGPPPPPDYEEAEYYPPYPPYPVPFRPNANNSGFPFPSPRGRGHPPPFRRGFPRRRGDNLSFYFDRLSNADPYTWYPSKSQENFHAFPRGRGRRPFPRRGRGRGFGRGRRGRFSGDEAQN